MTVHLQDELPRIGCGHRTVWAKVSRKWTYICDTMGNRAKLPTVRFNQIKRSCDMTFKAPTNDYEAFVLALELSASAPTEENENSA